MKLVGIAEAKNNLSALLDQVAAGEDVVIVDRGRPVARLEAIGRAYPDPAGRAERLERAGIVAPARGGSVAEVLDSPPIPMPPGTDVLGALLEERAEGR